MSSYYLLAAVPLLCLSSGTLYWYDKRQAEAGRRRIPEISLLTLDALGGWPGGWWAQQRFRHKTKKWSYRVRFYLAIAINLALLYLVVFAGSP